jgi:hypothetical protein
MSETDPPKAGASDPPGATQAVEGIPPRDQIVTFTQQHHSYFPGESAAFTPEEVERLAELGVIDAPPAGAAPVNVAVPAVTQDDVLLNCTMGEWSGEPTSYAYQWQIDGADAGLDAASYITTTDDVGKTATCVVTATNATGSTAAPPSVGVVVADAAGVAATRSKTKK